MKMSKYQEYVETAINGALCEIGITYAILALAESNLAVAQAIKDTAATATKKKTKNKEIS